MPRVIILWRIPPEKHVLQFRGQVKGISCSQRGFFMWTLGFAGSSAKFYHSMMLSGLTEVTAEGSTLR